LEIEEHNLPAAKLRHRHLNSYPRVERNED
jgi:hypothetical protein